MKFNRNEVKIDKIFNFLIYDIILFFVIGNL